MDRLRAPAGLLAVLLLAVAACGGKDDGTSPAASPAVRSPLAELLGYSTDPADQAAELQRYIEQERKVQQAIVACMKQEGFDYVAQDPAAFMGSSGFDEDIAFDSKEWAEKYGFGMSTTFGSEGFGSPGVTPPTDPNQAYVESLSEAERAAYDKALYGEMPTFDPTSADTTAMASFEPSGCDGEARRSTDVTQAFYSEFGDEMQEIYEGIQNDPAIVAAIEQWTSCMAKAGYEYDTPDQMYEEASKKMEPFYGAGSFGGSGSVATIVTDEQASGAAGDATGITAPEPPPIDEAKLAEVQAWEKKVAVANWDCSRDLNRVQQEVSAQREQEFIDANRAQIDELLAEQD